MKQAYYILSPGAAAAPQFLSTVELTALEDFDARDVGYWVVDGDDENLSDTLHTIRALQNPLIYLRPIVSLVSTKARNAPHGQTDQTLLKEDFDADSAKKLFSTFHPINHWIDHLPASDSNTDRNIALRLLRFMASRDQEFSPVMASSNPHGFLYPLLEPMFAIRDIGTIETLQYLKGQRLLQGRFFKQAHFCSSCQSAFLNFEEQCPHCSSGNLRIDELVHHFKCAYTGELSEFQVGNQLACPKCEQQLRHIGVDYDKPSIIYHCNDCAHVFQDPAVSSSCYHCGHTASPEDQITRIIEHYTVTSLGQNAAVYGMESLFSNILSSNLQLTSEAVFKEYLRLESARISRYQVSTTSLVMVNIKQLDEIYIKLGDKAKNVFHELSAVFKSILRTSDVITSINETLFLILMTETSAQNAKRALERLQQGVTELMRSNLDLTPVFNTRIKQLAPKMDVAGLLETFLHENSDADRPGL